MLTTHQAKKLIADELAGPGRTYLYLGYARKVHYFRHQVANATEPSHNLLALRIEDEAQAFSARRGTSYFQQLAQIVVAPGFSRWQPEVGREQFTSKQSAKRAFARLLSTALGEVGFHSSYLSLRDDQQLRELFTFLRNAREQLAVSGSPARDQLKERATPELYQQLLHLAELESQEQEESVLDDYLESLGQDGSYQGSAGFTINRGEALRKLTDYQLGDPVLFPMFLAVGLSLAGAARIEIEIDSDETWVRFHGTNLAESVLSDIPAALLSYATGDEQLALQALGRALLQGASHQPQALRLETSDGNLDLRDFPKSFAPVPWPKPDQAGTFYRRQRFGLQVAGRYLKSRYAPHAEVSELLSALAFLDVPWSVNGQQHDGALVCPAGTLAVLWRHPGQRLPELKSAHLSEHLSPLPASVLFRFHPRLLPELRAVRTGLLMELPEQKVFVPTTEVTLWLPEMATDLSGRKLVDSQFLSEVLNALPNLQERAWKEMLPFFHDLDDGIKTRWVGPFLRAVRDKFPIPGLLDLAFLPCVAQDNRISVQQWGNAKRQLFSPPGQQFAHPLLAGDPVVATRPEWVGELKALTPNPLDATSELQHTARYQKNLQDWLAQPKVPLTLPSDIPVELSLSLPDGQGFLFVDSLRRPQRQLLCQERPLPVALSDRCAPPHVGFLLKADQLAMDWDWRQAVPAHGLEALEAVVAAHIVKLARAVGRLEYLETEEQRHRFCYLLAFLKVRGQSLLRWNDLAFLPHPKLGGASLSELPDYLTPYLKELA